MYAPPFTTFPPAITMFFMLLNTFMTKPVVMYSGFSLLFKLYTISSVSYSLRLGSQYIGNVSPSLRADIVRLR